MRRLRWVLPLFIISGCKQAPPVPAPVEPVQKVVEEATKALAPPPPVFTGYDESNLDRAADPCQDFYQYACGGWMAKTEIPADQSRWGSFSEIDERNKKLLRETLEQSAAGAAGKADAGNKYAGKLGDFWTSCMDESAIEKNADADVKALLAKVDKVSTIAQLADVSAELFLRIANPIFELGAEQDFKDATQMIAVLDQGGIGLPDRDYYLQDNAKFKDLRDKYVAHVQRMFELAGDKPDAAQKNAQAVMKIETELAKGSLSRVDRRDPNKIYHRINLAGIEKTAPKWPWKAYFKKIGHPTLTEINVTTPDFFKAVNGLLSSVKMPEWRTYLRWHALHGASNFLSKKYADETFAFYGTALRGLKELKPRWKRCVEYTDRALGEALAQSFVAQTFGESGKAQTLAMVHAVEQAMRDDLSAISWMDEATKKNAFEKLESIANKIGYPDKWRNYDALAVGRESLLKNWMAAGEFETHRQLDKVGKPVDRGEFLMTPPSVNAYYNPSLNEMVFPAGILQSPFFDGKALPAVNYGAIGMVMGHELTHGFDDEGRKFDGKGNLREWWSPTVNAEFERRADCVSKQYDGYVAIDDLHLNGKLTLGENIADLGGVKLAFLAMKKTKEQAAKAEGAAGKEAGASDIGKAVASAARGGFTDEQLFFLGYAQAWCSRTRPEEARMRVTTDPHAPPQHRVNGPLSNTPEFAQAFQCKAGSNMVRAEQCVVW